MVLGLFNNVEDHPSRSLGKCKINLVFHDSNDRDYLARTEEVISIEFLHITRASRLEHTLRPGMGKWQPNSIPCFSNVFEQA